MADKDIHILQSDANGVHTQQTLAPGANAGSLSTNSSGDVEFNAASSADADTTDSSGGSAGASVAAVSGSGDDSTINDNFATVVAELNAVKAILRTHNLLET